VLLVSAKTEVYRVLCDNRLQSTKFMCVDRINK
jgi:hypothetical protein